MRILYYLPLIIILHLISMKAVDASLNAEKFPIEIAFIKEVVIENSNSIYPIELWTKRDVYDALKHEERWEKMSLYDQLHYESGISTHKDTSIYDLSLALQEIKNNKAEFLSSLPSDKNVIYERRLSQLIEMADKAIAMSNDSWKNTYIDNLTRTIMELRYLGISNKLPSMLWQVPVPENSRRIIDVSTMIEEQARVYDLGYQVANKTYAENLSSINPALKSGLIRYMEEKGADIGLLENWFKQETKNSYDTLSLAAKIFYAKQRNVSVKSYSWVALDEANLNGHGPKTLKTSMKEYKKLIEKDESAVNVSFTIWHAFTQEILAQTEFRHKNKETQQLRLIQTHSFVSKSDDRFNINQNKKYNEKEVYEAYNVFFPERALGKEIVTLQVPYHRIVSIDFFDIIGKHESKTINKVLAITQDIEEKTTTLNEIDLVGNASIDERFIEGIENNRESILQNAQKYNVLNTILYSSAMFSNDSISSRLIAIGADPNAKVNLSENKKMGKFEVLTPIAAAIAMGDSNYKMVNLMLNNGGNLDEKNTQGLGLVYLSTIAKSPKILSLLVKKGLNPNKEEIEVSHEATLEMHNVSMQETIENLYDSL